MRDAQRLDLLSGQQHRVVVRMPGDWQPPTLDCIGKNDGGLADRCVRLRQHIEQFRQVVPAQI